MSGGGGDKSRAGFTSRVVVITETDGMDQPGLTSREADKITQLEARTRAYGSRKRIYMECTVSTEQGRTWQEYTQGTQSRIVLPCPHCKAWVSPEREHLTGWQGADSQAAARQVSGKPGFISGWPLHWDSREP
jgi:phage terminase large subunit GpA-like protein